MTGRLNEFRFRSRTLVALTSGFDLGCVKTPTSNFRVERLSRLRRIRKEPLWRAPSKEEKRENNSAHSPRVHVFTQPESKPEKLNGRVCFPLCTQRTDIAQCS